MAVHTLFNSFQYPKPNIKLIKDNREALNYKIRTLSTIYLPVLAEQLNALQQEINLTDKQALSALTLISTAFSTTEITDLHNITETLRLKAPTPEQEEAIKIYYKEIKSLIESGTVSTSKHLSTLNNNLINLKAVTLSDNEYRIKELETSINNNAPYIPEEEQVIAQLKKEETHLNEAIKAIEAIDTFSLIKGVLLTAEQLTSLNLSAPQVELIKKGLAAAGKILDLISDQLKYDNLIQARRKIQERLDDRRSNLNRFIEDVKNLQIQKNQLLEFQSVQALREIFTQEMSVLVDAIDKFLELTAPDGTDGLEVFIKRYIEQSGIFMKHLKSIREEWQR
ncbi:MULTISPECIES: alpha-xenorhabdolysin family binary toxin subunit B [unclassified Pseudomonas]|uniref:alpha-xenorhabdolysin family binary toxin subunit B n=1 Tax=unclassified Pseudomonas TaxID=196821 RepID=UPI00069F343C|nr:MULTISPECIES: alpha-xenorhabdolysin family binary toxin subunit B [unclassified Pseudomonas]WPN47920.1 alpha-xenorhabdolysin family binary toxin subunit B [Pseudomonas sp. P8_241]